MNFTKTFIDVESGQFISLPKDGTDKPPVNADINNNIDTFHSTGGEGTPSEPIPIVNVSEYDKTVCGRNLLNLTNIAEQEIRGHTVKCENQTFYINTTGTKSSDVKVLFTGKNHYFGVNISEFAAISNILLPIGTYRISMVNKSGTGLDDYYPYLYVLYTDNTQSGLLYFPSATASATLTAAKHIKGFLIQNYGQGTYTNVSFQIMVALGSTTVPYQPYSGKTYPYRLEAVDVAEYANFASLPATGVYGTQYKTLDDGKLWEWAAQDYLEFTLGSFPSGLQDLYDNDTSAIQSYKRKFIFKNITTRPSLLYSLDNETNPLIAFDYPLNTDVFDPDTSGTYGFARCTHFPLGAAWERETVCFSIHATKGFVFTIPKTELTGYAYALTEIEKEELFKNWLNQQYNNGTPVIVEYKTIDPVTYQIKKYGETYGGVVWEYNQKPQSIQYHTNIFTDKNITMQCEVRKLGNRKMSEFYWVTENGDKIITENGDYIMLEY